MGNASIAVSETTLVVWTGKEASDEASNMTKIDIDDSTTVLLPNTPPVPTPFALQVDQTRNGLKFGLHSSDVDLKMTWLSSSNNIYLWEGSPACFVSFSSVIWSCSCKLEVNHMSIPGSARCRIGKIIFNSYDKKHT